MNISRSRARERSRHLEIETSTPAYRQGKLSSLPYRRIGRLSARLPKRGRSVCPPLETQTTNTNINKYECECESNQGTSWMYADCQACCAFFLLKGKRAQLHCQAQKDSTPIDDRLTQGAPKVG